MDKKRRSVSMQVPNELLPSLKSSKQANLLNQSVDETFNDLNKSKLYDKEYISSKIDSFAKSDLMNQRIAELKAQTYHHYQHLNNTCSCGQCTCGRCRCELKEFSNGYQKDLGSQYMKQYPWKQIPYEKTGPRKEYKEVNTSLHKDSVYNEQFQPYQKQLKIKPHKGESNAPKPTLFTTPFSAINQYQVDYREQMPVETFILRPLDQYKVVRDLNTDGNSTYTNEYKYQTPSGVQFLNFAKLNSRKIHANVKDPYPYLSTTYNSVYQGNKGSQTNSIAQNSTLAPSHDNFTNYQTTQKRDYVPKVAMRCPARTALEQISQNYLSQGGEDFKST